MKWLLLLSKVLDHNLIIFFTIASSSRPWVNPNAPSVPVTKKFHVSLNSKQFESRVSKKAPYAPRSHSSLSTWETPKVVNGKAYLMPQYNSLEDPHLRDYFARKVGVKPKLSDRNSMKVSST